MSLEVWRGWTIGCSIRTEFERTFEPLNTQELRIDPYGGPSVLEGASGNDWVLFSVPDDSHSIELEFVSGLSGEWRTDVFDVHGEFVKTFEGEETTFPATGLLAGHSYYVRISNQNADAFFDVYAGATKPAGNGTSDAEPNALVNEGDFERVVFRPDGDAVHSVQSNQSIVNIPFTVDQAGSARLSFRYVGTGNISVHPLRTVSSGGEFDNPRLIPERAMDFSDRKVNGEYSLDIDLIPGLYLLRAERVGGTGLLTDAITLDLPAYDTTKLVYSPETGKTALEMQSFDRQLSGTANTDWFRPVYFTVTAPPGSLDGMEAIVRPADSGFEALVESEFDEKADFRVWQRANSSEFISDGVDVIVGDPETVISVDTQPAEDDFDTTADSELILSFSRFGLSGSANFAVDFVVPESGTPNLVVEQLELNPGGTETIVTGLVRNLGFGFSEFSLQPFHGAARRRGPSRGQTVPNVAGTAWRASVRVLICTQRYLQRRDVLR